MPAAFSIIRTIFSVSAAAGILVGMGYVAYQLYNEHEREQQKKHSTRRRRDSSDYDYINSHIYNKHVGSDYDYFNSQIHNKHEWQPQENKIKQRTNNNHERRQQEIKTKKKNSNCCALCRKNKDESFYELECGHRFHSECLTTNYLALMARLKISPTDYKCPNCKSAVPYSDYVNFTKPFQ